MDPTLDERLKAIEARLDLLIGVFHKLEPWVDRLMSSKVPGIVFGRQPSRRGGS